MALILLIDSSGEEASIHLGEDGILKLSLFNAEQKDHASWMHQAIESLLKSADKQMQELDAIGITSGPGSYTGLRVSMAAAKGFCFALNIPLITVNSLELLAASCSMEMENKERFIFVPMLDARRMEVFVAAYDQDLKEMLKPQPLILESGCFDALKESGKTLMYLGSGMAKWKNEATQEEAAFENVRVNGAAFLRLIEDRYNRKEFADLAYAEPVYLKEFYSHPS